MPLADPQAPGPAGGSPRQAARRRPWLLLAALAAAVTAAVVAMLGWNTAISYADQQAAKASAAQSAAARVPGLEQQVTALQNGLAAGKEREQALTTQAASAASGLAEARAKAAALDAAEQRAAAAEKAAADGGRARAEAQARVDTLEAAARAADLRPAPARPPPGAPASGAGGASLPGAAPEPPLPELPPGATARDYLVAAQQAIRAGEAGKAQAALERAETRLLNRASLAAGPSRPLRHPGVTEIEQALDQLEADDRDGALATVERLLAQR